MSREHGGEYICIDGHVAVDQQPFVKAIVNGSKQIVRDLLEGAEAILDPAGNGAYFREAQTGTWEDFDMCACKTHKGQRWMPLERFGVDKRNPEGRKRWCTTCRNDAEHQRRMREAERRGVRLRDRPGRPPKRRK